MSMRAKGRTGHRRGSDDEDEVQWRAYRERKWSFGVPWMEGGLMVEAGYVQTFWEFSGSTISITSHIDQAVRLWKMSGGTNSLPVKVKGKPFLATFTDQLPMSIIAEQAAIELGFISKPIPWTEASRLGVYALRDVAVSVVGTSHTVNLMVYEADSGVSGDLLVGTDWLDKANAKMTSTTLVIDHVDNCSVTVHLSAGATLEEAVRLNRERQKDESRERVWPSGLRPA